MLRITWPPNGNKRNHSNGAAAAQVHALVRQPVWPVTSFISPAPSLTPQPRGLWPTAFAPPSGGGYLTTDDSRTAKAACAARRHVSASASDLPIVRNLRLSNARVQRGRERR